MCRGRWVAYFVAFIILSSVFSLLSYSTFSYTMGVTATVTLSSEWKQALRSNSKTKIDTSRAHVAYITQYSLGIDKLPVEGQDIQLLVFKNGKVVDTQEKKTNASGFTDYIFVADQKGLYTIIIINKSDTAPFIVKNAIISL